MESSCRSLHRHAHAIVVAVRILALAPVTAQGVSCGKCLFYADLKHDRFDGQPAGRARALALQAGQRL